MIVHKTQIVAVDRDELFLISRRSVTSTSRFYTCRDSEKKRTSCLMSESYKRLPCRPIALQLVSLPNVNRIP